MGLVAIPFTNATLTAVRSAGTTGDYDVPAAPGAARWAGSVPVYVVRETREVEGSGRLDVIVKTRVEMPYVGIGELVRNGDVVAWTDEDGSHERAVASFTKVALLGRVQVWLVDE